MKKTLEEAAAALREKLSKTVPEVWSVNIGEDYIIVYTSTMKVWVDIPPVFPKGPEGYRVDLICAKPPVKAQDVLNLQCKR